MVSLETGAMEWPCMSPTWETSVQGERGAQGCDVLQTAEVRGAFPSLLDTGEGIQGWSPWLIQSGRLGQLLLYKPSRT